MRIISCCLHEYVTLTASFLRGEQKFAVTAGATIENAAQNRPVAFWLLGVAGLVGGMIVVGGATRLTRSGLSMVTWKPHGGLPPMTTAEWEEEFELYKQFPEYQQRKDMVRWSGGSGGCGQQWY